MEALNRAGVSPLLPAKIFPPPSPHHTFSRTRRPPTSLAFSRTSVSSPGNEVVADDVLQIFLRERQTNGDFITRVTDAIYRRNDLISIESDYENTVVDDHQQTKEDDNSGGFLKLTKTQEWIAGDTKPPVNMKLTLKERQNDSEKRKKLNFLQYEAIKRELLLLTAGIGVVCSGYCLVALSPQASISYAVGVLLSCLYLQLLYSHADNLSKEAVPSVFMQKRLKKIGIRSEDLQNLLERVIKGSRISLSSPRLVFPAVIYGIWALSNKFHSDVLDFQLVPAMFGLFAYKAAALVQVYRDNEDLRLVFPEEDQIPYDN